MLEFAKEYRRAAELPQVTGHRRKPLSRAPFRLLAIHAIELYLNALMLARGRAASEIRGLQHDMGARAGEAQKLGLGLKKNTVRHLRQLAASREYLCSRYAADTRVLSQLNRLKATLTEVGDKVAAQMGSKQL